MSNMDMVHKVDTLLNTDEIYMYIAARHHLIFLYDLITHRYCELTTCMYVHTYIPVYIYMYLLAVA